jgi:hypothetical protein
VVVDEWRMFYCETRPACPTVVRGARKVTRTGCSAIGRPRGQKERVGVDWSAVVCMGIWNVVSESRSCPRPLWPAIRGAAGPLIFDSVVLLGRGTRSLLPPMTRAGWKEGHGGLWLLGVSRRSVRLGDDDLIDEWQIWPLSRLQAPIRLIGCLAMVRGIETFQAGGRLRPV